MQLLYFEKRKKKMSFLESYISPGIKTETSFIFEMLFFLLCPLHFTLTAAAIALFQFTKKTEQQQKIYHSENLPTSRSSC